MSGGLSPTKDQGCTKLCGVDKTTFVHSRFVYNAIQLVLDISVRLHIRRFFSVCN